MIRTLRSLLLFVFIGLSSSVFGQEIGGRVLDDKKEPLPSAIVQVYSGGILKGGAATDLDGNYVVKPLDAGYYNVLVLYAGYDSIMITQVIVSSGNRTTQNFTMAKPKGKELPQVVVTSYKKPLVDQDVPDRHIMNKAEIEAVPTTDLADIVANAPGVYQSQRGGNVYIGGGRSTGTTYVIDGVVVQSSNDALTNTGISMSQGSVEQIDVIASGIPANYGDVSGGVVSITTRGSAPKLTGEVSLDHSIDGYNNNQFNFSIAGPILKKRIPGDSVHKKPVLGFSLSGDLYDDHDKYPTYDKQYVVKSDTLKKLLANPLYVSSNNAGNKQYAYSSDYITQSGLNQVRVVPNNVSKEARLGGKLDYQVTDNMHISAGGNFDYTRQDLSGFNPNYGGNHTNVLFASANTPIDNNVSGRGYIRFTQKFGKLGDTSSNHGLISNAYYAIQADYQKLSQTIEDPTFKKNIFDYAYVGKFTETKQQQYAAGFDSTSGHTGTILTVSKPTGISFAPDNLNPNLVNYTKEYYNSLSGVLPLSMQQIQSNYALVNGDEPQSTYSYNGVGLFASPGTTQNYYSTFNSTQYALSVDASFDLQVGKTKHAIGFGLYYQQRIERSYAVYANLGATNSLWQLMRQLVSSIDNTNLVLDKQHPIFVIKGVQYSYNQGKYYDPSGNVKNILPGPTDTIIYNYKNIGSGGTDNKGTTFDQNLRKELGLGPDQDINIDQYGPSTYNLNLFSADELLNSGNPFVNYFGYSYTGGAQAGTVNFNDFWTQKDANGNYTRPIGAFTPNDIAGYLMDKFTYKDMHFNIGVRVERYSANTQVLIDPYSLYPETTVGQNSSLTANKAINPNTANGNAPSNIGSNYIVYVADNNTATPTVIGYRNGANWYDPNGNYIEDPSILTKYSNGLTPRPLLQNAYKSITITDTNFNPNLSFTSYTPSVAIMPRLQFSFPISDVADFFAHYDIYSQRPLPSTLGLATAYNYYTLAQNAQNAIGNPNLKPEQTYDYEVGFQQKISEHSALTLNVFYKERKNQIALVDYLYAWPTTYYTYGNRDFSSTKGTSIFYDMRATNHLSMTLSYTLQFAEGTGSTPGAGKGLLGSFIEAGVPNLRYITPLNYDSRHTIVATIDYRYNDGEGPLVGGLKVLQNAGIHLIPKLRSGEPYTAYSDPLGNTVIGGVNGSRLPWHFGIDLKVDKDFALAFGNRRKNAPAGVKTKKPMFVKAVISVNNLLNTRDVLSVYGYTGKPNDNGYLASSYGQQYVPQQVNPTSYATLYSIYINDPGKINFARTINFALQFNF